MTAALTDDEDDDDASEGLTSFSSRLTRFKKSPSKSCMSHSAIAENTPTKFSTARKSQASDDDEFLVPSDSSMPPSSHRRSSSGSSSASSRRSSVATDSEEDSFIADDSDEDAQPKKGKGQGASKQSRPSLKKAAGAASSAGNSSFSFLTAAEQREQGKKNDKKAAEDPYSFLQDVRDVSACPSSLSHASQIMFSDLMVIQKDGVRPGEPKYDPRTLYVPKSAWKDFTPFEKQVYCI